MYCINHFFPIIQIYSTYVAYILHDFLKILDKYRFTRCLKNKSKAGFLENISFVCEAGRLATYLSGQWDFNVGRSRTGLPDFS
jgi:HD superfamily phosphohydrolase YqeK